MIDFSTFYGLLQAGNELIAADWLQELDVEYYTEIARQLRGEHGKWLAGKLLLYKEPFICYQCRVDRPYGYYCTLYYRFSIVKQSLVFQCEKCISRIFNPVGGCRWKVQAI